MSLAQCEACRLSLVSVVYDGAGGEVGGYACQLDLSEHFRDRHCPFHVDWNTELPPPSRSCKKSVGTGINGCSTGGCGTGGCGSGGCGSCSTSDDIELDEKYDPQAEPMEAQLVPWDTDAVRPLPDLDGVAEDAHDEHEHDEHDHHAGHDDHGHDDHHDHGHDDHGHDDHHDHGHDDHHETAPGKPDCGSCGALKALDRMGLGNDASAPVPIPLGDDD